MLRDAAALDELWIGEMKGVVLDGTPVLLVRLDDGVRAYADRCCAPGRAALRGATRGDSPHLPCARVALRRGDGLRHQPGGLFAHGVSGRGARRADRVT